MEPDASAPGRFEVLLLPQARREVLAAPAHVQDRFFAAMDDLAKDPFASRLAVTHLRGTSDPPLYRLRVGLFRSIYLVRTPQRQLVVLMLARRELGYKRMLKKAKSRLRSLF